MRRLITGVRDGRSCIVEEVDYHPDEAKLGGSEFTSFPVGPGAPRPPGRGAWLDLHTPAGHLRWSTVRFAPNGGYPQMHHTDTIDCHTIVAGSIDLILDDGPHRLTAGDCLVVTGVDHAWQAGEDGCVTSIIIIGTPAP